MQKKIIIMIFKVPDYRNLLQHISIYIDNILLWKHLKEYILDNRVIRCMYSSYLNCLIVTATRGSGGD